MQERTARMRAKKDCFVKACSCSFHDNNDEDLKVTDVSPIKSLFSNMNLDKDGTGDESNLVRRRTKNSVFLDLDAKIGKSGIGEVMTLNSTEPTISDFKESTSREILSMFLANSSILSNFSSIKALKFFCKVINSLIVQNQRESY